jgi:hypothetical protein
MSRETDNEWPLPEGFVACLTYPDGHTGVRYVGLAALKLEGVERELSFVVKEDRSDTPALPLRGHGELWHTGWDIPTRWAIDAKGRCFMDSAHGGSMGAVDFGALLATCEREADLQAMQKLLGLPVDAPAWQRTARASGWISAESAETLRQELEAARRRLPSEEQLVTLLETVAPSSVERPLDVVEACMDLVETLQGARETLSAALHLLPVRKP